MEKKSRPSARRARGRSWESLGCPWLVKLAGYTKPIIRGMSPPSQAKCPALRWIVLRSAPNIPRESALMAAVRVPHPACPRRQLRRRDPVRLRAGRRPRRTHPRQSAPRIARSAQRFQILVVPGGFTYGDDVAAGKILANQLANFLGDALRRFRDAEKLILGICNGFQALLKAGLLVPPDEDGPLATLAHNSSGKFEDRWIYLQATSRQLPLSHGHRPAPSADRARRGPLPLPRGVDTARTSSSRARSSSRYVDSAGKPGGYPVNPNGSQGDVAGICDATGRVLGLMPHPERHVLPTQHPRWTRRAGRRGRGTAAVSQCGAILRLNSAKRHAR